MEQKQSTIEEMYKILIQLRAKMEKMDQYLEDLEFARRTEEAWQEIDEGKGKKMSVDEFVNEIRSLK